MQKHSSKHATKKKATVEIAAPIKIVGTDTAGKIVATESTDQHWHAKRIAATWRDSGLTVTIDVEAAA